MNTPFEVSISSWAKIELRSLRLPINRRPRKRTIILREHDKLENPLRPPFFHDVGTIVSVYWRQHGSLRIAQSIVKCVRWLKHAQWAHCVAFECWRSECHESFGLSRPFSPTSLMSTMDDPCWSNRPMVWAHLLNNQLTFSEIFPSPSVRNQWCALCHTQCSAGWNSWLGWGGGVSCFTKEMGRQHTPHTMFDMACSTFIEMIFH